MIEIYAEGMMESQGLLSSSEGNRHRSLPVPIEPWLLSYRKMSGNAYEPLSSGCRNLVRRVRIFLPSIIVSILLFFLAQTIMGSVQQASTPYLFPFVVEYSIICAGMLFVTWARIGLDTKTRTRRMYRHYLPPQETEDADSVRRVQNARSRAAVDCSGSTVGLFVGLLSIVFCVISLILFFVWIGTVKYAELAVQQLFIVEIGV